MKIQNFAPNNVIVITLDKDRKISIQRLNDGEVHVEVDENGKNKLLVLGQSGEWV